MTYMKSFRNFEKNQPNRFLEDDCFWQIKSTMHHDFRPSILFHPMNLPTFWPVEIYVTSLSKCDGSNMLRSPSLKLTAQAPENRPGSKRKGSSSKHPFSGAKMLVYRKIISPKFPTETFFQFFSWSGGQLKNLKSRNLTTQRFLTTPALVSWIFGATFWAKKTTYGKSYILQSSYCLITGCFQNHPKN